MHKSGQLKVARPLYSPITHSESSPLAVFCQIPCLSGGRCIGRDLCWCPSNSTGKFCHLPVPQPPRPTTQSHKDAGHQGPKAPSHSMYTLPLSNQQGKAPPLCGTYHWQPPFKVPSLPSVQVAHGCMMWCSHARAQNSSPISPPFTSRYFVHGGSGDHFNPCNCS